MLRTLVLTSGTYLKFNVLKPELNLNYTHIVPTSQKTPHFYYFVQSVKAVRELRAFYGELKHISRQPVQNADLLC